MSTSTTLAAEWYLDGFVVAATEGGEITDVIHAGVVDTIPATRYTLSALCRRYRTKGGNRLARPASLSRSAARPFAVLADGHDPMTGAKLRVCRWCVSVFNDLDQPVVLDEPKPF